MLLIIPLDQVCCRKHKVKKRCSRTKVQTIRIHDPMLFRRRSGALDPMAILCLRETWRPRLHQPLRQRRVGRAATNPATKRGDPTAKRGAPSAVVLSGALPTTASPASGHATKTGELEAAQEQDLPAAQDGSDAGSSVD
jgi:hypothetical protein